MPSSLSSSCSFRLPFCTKFKQLNHPLVRSQSFSFKDDGASANMVDANMGILRERMEEVRMKEKRMMKKCLSRSLENGWNYQGYGYDNKHKRHAIFSESLAVLRSASGALAFVFSVGSLSIFLVSLLVHLATNH